MSLRRAFNINTIACFLSHGIIPCAMKDATDNLLYLCREGLFKPADKIPVNITIL
jgi:hypothetical protein